MKAIRKKQVVHDKLGEQGETVRRQGVIGRKQRGGLLGGWKRQYLVAKGTNVLIYASERLLSLRKQHLRQPRGTRLIRTTQRSQHCRMRRAS